LIDENLLKKVSNLLKEKNLKLATAESCTGGLIANTLTNISGSSDYFDRGIVSYSNKAKTELLGVSEDIIKKYGAVSKQVVKVMAEGIRLKSNVDIGVATTGIAGPTGGTKEKPVGLVFIGISTKKGTYIRRYKFNGNRLQNKELTCNAALWMILEHIKNEGENF
jgi:PncC family amidohydrolase